MRRFRTKFSFTDTDFEILDTVNNHKNNGNILLSKKVGIAPKNLIPRIRKLSDMGLLNKQKIPLKPKGWKRNYSITKEGIAFNQTWLRTIHSDILKEHPEMRFKPNKTKKGGLK